jgi:gliding motility-associated-like protein
MSGVYSVTVSVGTCTASATTSVTVNALPIPIVNSNSPVCANTSINFTGSGGTTYAWAGPAFTSNLQNPIIANASAANSGTYTLTVTDANSCVSFTTTTVVVNPLPVIVVNNPTVCANQTLNFTATGGANYAWSGPAGFTSALQNPSITTAATNMSGAYTVTVTTAAGCSLTAVSNGVVNPLPNPVAQSNSPVCVGNTINLIGSGGTTYTWTGPNAFSSNLQSPNIPNCGMPNSGTNTLTVGNAFGCIASATVNVVVNPLPTPQIISNSPVCVGQPINFTGSGGTTYAWSGPGLISNIQNPNISLSSMSNSGTYTLTVVDANNCVNSITQNVVVNPLPNPTAVGSTACENSNVTLSATGGVSYSWTGPGGFTSGSQNATISNAQLTASGQYTVVVTDVNSCTNTAVANIIVNPMPVANAGSNGPICVNTNLNLSGNGGVSYSWSGPNGFTSNLQNPTFNANSLNYSGNYNLTVTDVNGCTSSTVVPVVINGIPSGAVQSNIQEGCAPLCVTFTINSSASIANYNWNLGNGVTANTPSPETCYGTTGIYTISAVVSDAIGCTSTVTYTVEVYPQPIADFNHAPLKPIINIDPEVVFTDASYGTQIVSWNWYFMNSAQYTSNVQNPTFMYAEPGTYAVALVVKSDKGCTDTIVRPLVVGEDFGIYVPNAFTPNDDGLNDIFQPKGFGIVKYELQIFDRWGERVFNTKTFEKGWDGKYLSRGGEIIEEGVYTWLINVTSVFGKAHELKGHVTLIK